MIISKHLVSFTLMGSALLGVDSLKHASLRHRDLVRTCITKYDPCGGDLGDDCCGKAECRGNYCCLPEGTKGCEFDDDCCGEETTCDDSRCSGGTGDEPGGRNCGIHGEDCTIENGGNTCCGNTKYQCKVVNNEAGPTCCMEENSKGCTYDRHCCGYIQGDSDGIYCTDSTCLRQGEDPPVIRTCEKKGGVCESEEDCCGSTRLGCEEGTCCIKGNLKGCEGDDDCCSGNCNTEASQCVAA